MLRVTVVMPPATIGAPVEPDRTISIELAVVIGAYE